MKRPKPETSLVRSVIAWLLANGIMAWRVNTGMQIAEYKGVRRAIRFGEPGMADVLAILPGGRLLAIECKAGKNQLSEKQKDWLCRAAAAGALTIVARSLSDVESALLERKPG